MSVTPFVSFGTRLLASLWKTTNCPLVETWPDTESPLPPPAPFQLPLTSTVGVAAVAQKHVQGGHTIATGHEIVGRAGEDHKTAIGTDAGSRGIIVAPPAGGWRDFALRAIAPRRLPERESRWPAADGHHEVPAKSMRGCGRPARVRFVNPTPSEVLVFMVMGS